MESVNGSEVTGNLRGNSAAIIVRIFLSNLPRASLAEAPIPQRSIP